MREKVRNKIGRKSRLYLVLMLAISVITGLSSVAAFEITGSNTEENLVAEYRLNTGAGGTAYDNKNGNDGTINGAGWSVGKKGQSLLFDSSSEDYVQTQNNLDIPQKYSLFIWIKGDLEDQLSENIYPFGFNNKIEMTASSSSNARGGILIRNQADDGYHSVWDGTNVLDGSWHHWGATVNRNTGIVRIYLDGKNIYEETIPDHYSGSRQLNIGSWSETYGHFNGKISQAKFYSDALNTSEVKSLYNSGSLKVKTPNNQIDPSKVLDLNLQHVQNGEVLDTSGNNNHGSIQNGATQVGSAGCKVGRCFSFDGNDDRIDLNQPNDIISSSITHSAWIKIDDTSARQITGQDQSHIHSELQVEGDGSVHFWMEDSSDADYNVFTNPLDDGSWHHVLGTYDNQSGEMRMYVDGKEVDRATYNFVPVDTANNFRIGHGDTGYYDGLIDQVKVFDRSLSQKEVWKLYTKEKNRFSNGMAGPVAHYPMKTESSPLVDVAGGNDGSLDAIGEAGTFNTSNGNWQTVYFRKNYTNPVVVGTTNTHNGQSAIYFETRNVQSNKAEMRLCESEGGNNDGCDSHGTERGGYIIVDAASTDQVSGIEAGKFTTSSNSVSFSNGFTNTPVVFTQVMTDNNEGEVVSWVTSKDNESFNAKICDQNSNDGCASPDEEFGWIAVEPGNEPFAQTLEAKQLANEVGSSNWASTTFDSSFSERPVGVFSVQNNDGGQDPKVDEIRNVDLNGMEMRFCELETGDTCDGHVDMAYAYLAAEEGLLTTQNSNSPKYVDTQRGKALEFDGNDDYVDTGFSFDKDQLTYSAWVKADGSTSGLNVIDSLDSNSEEWSRLQTNNGKLRFTVDNNGVKEHVTGGALDDGEWHHVIGVWNNGDMRVYLDGQLKGTHTHSETDTIEGRHSEIIGAQAQDFTNENWDGKIDDVGIYPYALNQEQVSQVMNNGAVNIG